MTCLPEDAIVRPIRVAAYVVCCTASWDPKSWCNVKDFRPKGRRTWELIDADEDHDYESRTWIARLTPYQFWKWVATTDLSLRDQPDGEGYLRLEGNHINAELNAIPAGHKGDWEPLLRDETWYKVHTEAPRPFITASDEDVEAASDRLWERLALQVRAEWKQQ